MTTAANIQQEAYRQLGLDTQTAAGARAMIQRALALDGLSFQSKGPADAETLATWALRHPDQVAPRVAAKFKEAALKWNEGNDSGDPYRLRACKKWCDEYRKQAALVCALFGIERVDFPGLYPTFVRGGRTWYSGDEARALRGE